MVLEVAALGDRREDRVIRRLLTAAHLAQLPATLAGGGLDLEGEALAAGSLADASDVMMAHPLALQLRNLQTLVELGVDKNTTVVFPAPLMSTISDLGAFLNREAQSANQRPPSRVTIKSG